MIKTTCPKCNAKLQFPLLDSQYTMVRCPVCKHTFHPATGSQFHQPTQLQGNYGKFIGIGIAALVVIGIIFLLGPLFDSGSKPQVQTPPVSSIASSKSPPHAAYIPRPTPMRPRWIRASYRGLVDMRDLTQSGETIQSAIAGGVKTRHERGQLQPLLDQFSRLLPQALETAGGGPGEFPRTSIIDELPANSSLPAWVSIFKGGRIVVTDDGNGTASVFAIGADARQAYEVCYSVVRHALAALLPSNGGNLKVRTYAYQNDYAACELKLCLDPYVIEAKDFPAPPGKTPLDLDSLGEFLSRGYELTGGSVDSNNKLTLVGKKGAKQTLASSPIELADLAVAYRAVFHAGDNQAFISLDPHRDPTRVNVSFGGYLEDTRIGAVVLEADKRFKTITSGLDPTSFVDLRNEIRAHVPGFASSSERDLAQPGNGHTGWQGTRFWYYPDSVEIEASLDYRQGAIAKAQFTADAERSRDDFGSSVEFDKAKKSKLSPTIQMNINDLNQNYSQYAEFFPELRELSVVARLMGLCIWMQKADMNQVDLDQLLTVELPAAPTPREKRQLISAALISIQTHTDIQLSDVAARAVVRYLTPLLDKTVNDLFPTDDLLAEFLAESTGGNTPQAAFYSSAAKVFRSLHGNDTISQVVTNRQTLRAFASVAAGTIDVPQAPGITALHDTITTKKAEIARFEAHLQSVETSMNSGGADVYNSYVDNYNALARQIRVAQNEVNDIIDNYNSRKAYSQQACEISGGIELGPSKYKIRALNSSPDLVRTKQVAEMKDTSTLIQGEEWGRSTPTKTPAPRKALQLNRSWVAGDKKQTQTATMSSVSNGKHEAYWRSSSGAAGNWQDQTIRPRTATERYYDSSSRTLQVADFEDGKLKTCMVGKYDGQGLIVFEKSARQNISSPQQPPKWWD